MSWWADKLGSDASQRTPPPAMPPANPSRATQTQFPWPARPTKVTVENLVEAAEQWQGGQGTADSKQSCPNCGGAHYFALSNTSIVTQNGMATATPRCYDCNYMPGRVAQGLPPV